MLQQESTFLGLESLLPQRRGRKSQERVPGEEIFEFFDERPGIVLKGVASFCGVSPSALSQWRSQGVPRNRLARLRELVDKITAWEQKSGKRFPG